MKRFLGTLMAILREIADENAYQRHLKVHGAVHSGEEWRRFCDEHWNATARRPRCC
jgi:hypothetical protein